MTGFITALLCPLSFLLAAAHFLRGGYGFLAAASLACIAFSVINKRWSRSAAFALLSFFFLHWAYTAVMLIAGRLESGAPWMRLAVIMAAAALFIALSAVTAWRARSSLPAEPSGGPALAAMIATAGILAIARHKAPFTILLADRFLDGLGGAEIVLLSAYAGFLAEKFLSAADTTALRVKTWTLFSVIFFLQFAIGISGFDIFLMTGNLHVPVPAVIAAGPAYRGGGYFMVVLFISTVLLAGPAWCSRLCYFGAWDNRAALARKRPGPAIPRSQTLRFTSLAAVLVSALIFRLIDLPSGTAALAAISFGITGAAVMIVVSRKRGVMAHCTAFCPLGLAASFIGRISPFRIVIDKNCTSCMACSARCRYGALGKADIIAGKPSFSCTLCGDCIDACRRGSLRYRFLNLSPESSLRLFTVITVALHASFLGLARI